MPQKRYRPEEVIAKLRETDVLLGQGKKVSEVVRTIGVSEVSYYRLAQGVRGLKNLASQASERARARKHTAAPSGL
jgi:transposase